MFTCIIKHGSISKQGIAPEVLHLPCSTHASIQKEGCTGKAFSSSHLILCLLLPNMVHACCACYGQIWSISAVLCHSLSLPYLEALAQVYAEGSLGCKTLRGAVQGTLVCLE
jgi:hypothetical protein